jgi:pimeloyl-ACP methyl ester carboxylesterase
MVRRERAAILGGLLGGLLLAGFGALHAGAATGPGYRIALEVPGRSTTALYAEESGDGPPLILLHGLGGSLFTWRHVVTALSREHRVIALDMKGFGQSDKPFDEHYSAADQAALVSAFIRKRGLSGVTLVGHSFGGVVALRTARDFAREPGVIARLVVMDTPALQQDLSDGAWFFSVPRLPYVAMAVTPPDLMTRMMLRLVSAPARVQRHRPVDRRYERTQDGLSLSRDRAADADRLVPSRPHRAGRHRAPAGARAAERTARHPQ